MLVPQEVSRRPAGVHRGRTAQDDQVDGVPGEVDGDLGLPDGQIAICDRLFGCWGVSPSKVILYFLYIITNLNSNFCGFG